MTDAECHICGNCWWQDCDNPADYEVDVELKRHGLHLYSGKVDLCQGHAEFATRGQMMNLRWASIEQALARQHALS